MTATPPTTRGGDDFQLEAVAAVRLHLRRLHDVHHRGEAGERAHEDEDAEGGALGIDAGEARGFGIGADGIDEAAGGEIFHRPCGGDQQDDGDDDERRSGRRAG